MLRISSAMVLMGLLLLPAGAVAQPSSRMAQAYGTPDSTPLPGRLISSVVVNSPTPWAAGQVVTVVLHGVSGGQASFDLGPIIGVPLTETQMGVYTGSYMLTDADAQLVNPVLMGHLHMPGGQTEDYGPRPRPVPLTIDVNTGGMPALSAGQTFQVTVRGPSGGTGSLDVANHFGLPLAEISPGIYIGSYTVQPTDPSGPLAVQAHLVVNGVPLGVVAATRIFVTGGQPAPPQITSISTTNPGPVYPNQGLSIVATGPPYENASMMIGGISYPMTETSPGSYVATWTVPPGFPSGQLPVTVQIQDAMGHAITRQAPFLVNVAGSSVPSVPVAAGNVVIDYPTMRSEVTSGFGVAGRAVPGALLHVQVFVTRDPIPGGTLLANQFDTQVQANSDGSYNVPIVLNGASSGQYLDIRVQSADASGAVVGQDEVVVTLR